MTDVTTQPTAVPAGLQDTTTIDSDSHARTDHDRQNDNDSPVDGSEQLPPRVGAISGAVNYILEECKVP